MSSILSAKAAWEQATLPFPISNQTCGEIMEEPFRQYGDAIAWLEWDDGCTIYKLETLKPKTGAASALLAFLKELAQTHNFVLRGNPVAYVPTSDLPAGDLLSQVELERWFYKHAFAVRKSSDGVPVISYPAFVAIEN